MHWDINQGLLAVLSMDVAIDQLKELFHDGEDVLNHGIQPNEVANGTAINMFSKATNYGTMYVAID
eukprot:486598-Ditylum_brightwellii.AAC.1